jgi:hypothetical protein
MVPPQAGLLGSNEQARAASAHHPSPSDLYELALGDQPVGQESWLEDEHAPDATAAAIKIQSRHRGWSVRAELRKRVTAACKIQATFRGSLVRRSRTIWDKYLVDAERQAQPAHAHAHQQAQAAASSPPSSPPSSPQGSPPSSPPSSPPGSPRAQSAQSPDSPRRVLGIKMPTMPSIPHPHLHLSLPRLTSKGSMPPRSSSADQGR